MGLQFHLVPFKTNEQKSWLIWKIIIDLFSFLILFNNVKKIQYKSNINLVLLYISVTSI